MNKTIMITTLVLLLTLFTVSANGPEFYRIVNQESYIELPCSANNGTCPIETECKLDVTSPSGESVISNQNMTRLNNRFKYQYTFLDTGEHKAYMYCQSETEFGDRSFSVFVLEENYNYGNGGLINSSILIGLEAFAIILFIVFMFGKKNVVIGYASAILNFVGALVVWTQGININITSFNIPLYYRVPLLLSSGIGFMLVIFGIWLMWYSSNYQEDVAQSDKFEYRDEI